MSDNAKLPINAFIETVRISSIRIVAMRMNMFNGTPTKVTRAFQIPTYSAEAGSVSYGSMTDVLFIASELKKAAVFHNQERCEETVQQLLRRFLYNCKLPGR